MKKKSNDVYWPKYCGSLWQLPSLITALHNHLSNWAFNRLHQSYCISHLQKSRNPCGTPRMTEWLQWADWGVEGSLATEWSGPLSSHQSAAPQHRLSSFMGLGHWSYTTPLLLICLFPISGGCRGKFD